MISSHEIKYCLQSEIDIIKWDRCIANADNGLIYAYSFYLNEMAGNWDALILNDYDAVMPLPWKRKLGFYYLYQPYFIPSLGIFGKQIRHDVVTNFLSAVPQKFKYWDIKLNEANCFITNKDNSYLDINLRTNYLLSLGKSHQNLKAGYKRLCLRMIKKAPDNSVQVTYDGKPADVIEFYRKLYNGKHENILPSTYNNLHTVTSLCISKSMAKVYLAKLPGGEITAVYLVLVDDKFVYSLIGGSSEKGKQTGSFYLLTDAAIRDHAESKRTFRFEGSDIPGIALFDSQFGPAMTSYPRLIMNKLPFPINFLK